MNKVNRTSQSRWWLYDKFGKFTCSKLQARLVSADDSWKLAFNQLLLLCHCIKKLMLHKHRGKIIDSQQKNT